MPYAGPEAASHGYDLRTARRAAPRRAGRLLFHRAEFPAGIVLGGVTVEGHADFSGAAFGGDARFAGAMIAGDATFRRVVFAHVPTVGPCSTSTTPNPLCTLRGHGEGGPTRRRSW
ncbi:pentapeptide repeat-containing protein [Streptomyces cacaoi]|nr:pentapeptide repeat-containing protein [Streptomyces cacaoi]